MSKLGKYIELSDLKNIDQEYTEDSVVGISTKKGFIETKGDLTDVDIRTYRIVKPRYFAYVEDTSRRGDKISLAFNSTQQTLLVSTISKIFHIIDENELLPEYLFMYFNRPEFDRYSRFNSWGSARETFSYEDLCDIDINIPSIKKQKQVVDVYLALVENQKMYEQGIDDLKLVCDAFIEKLRKTYKVEKIGSFLDISTEKNSNNCISKIIGVGTEGIIPPKVDGSENTSNYNIVRKNYFLYNPSRINIGSIGLYKNDEIVICSPIYNVFHVMSDNLLPEYLMMWYRRDEFKRYTDFYSLASVRNNFSLDLMTDVEIPIPSVAIQKAISDISKVYTTRKQISEKLKLIVSQICPVLIRGSLK